MSDGTPTAHSDASEAFPDLQRLAYYRGQLLGVDEFQAEQRYHREKQRLHNRFLHGYGIVCGFQVTPLISAHSTGGVSAEALRRIADGLDRVSSDLGELAERSAASEEERVSLAIETQDAMAAHRDLKRELVALGADAPPDQPTFQIEVTAGFAIDCAGRELVLAESLEVDLLSHLSTATRCSLEAAGARGETLYVTVRYLEELVEPATAVTDDSLLSRDELAFTRIRETVLVEITSERSFGHDTCEPCQMPANECCPLLLAALHNVTFAEGALAIGSIDNGARRGIAKQAPTRVHGIGWEHGASYRRDDLGLLVNRDGLRLLLSRPVLTQTLLAPGTVRMEVSRGGPGRSGHIERVPGTVRVADPTSRTTTEFWFQNTSAEPFDHGDELRLIIKGDFVLDECSRPLDGNHLGGFVPPLPSASAPVADQPRPYPAILEQVPAPPEHDGGWSSGNEYSGGDFESWVYVAPDAR